MAMTDAKRLPVRGRTALVDMFNCCEDLRGRPWQCMLALVMLQPKPKVDRALALITWFCRCWELLNRQQMREWALGMQTRWDAAAAAKSRLREAMARVISDEIARELNIAH
eukprot:8416904-Pyramimonas_sp.AAC.1